jgi:hypothetical protein
MIIGVLAALFAFTTDTTVTSTGTFIGGSYVGGGSTYNLGLLQFQMMVLHTGLAGFVAGAVLYGTGELADANAESRPTPLRWTDIQPDETEEERDERVERIRRRGRITLIGAAAFIAALIAFALWLANSDSTPSPTMNIDENLTTADMNVDENLTTSDMNVDAKP